MDEAAMAGEPSGAADVGKEGEFVRRFLSRKAARKAKKYGIAIDATKGLGVPAASSDIEPIDPDWLKRMLGVRHADYYVDIAIEGKRVLRRRTKAGYKEIVILSDIAENDVVFMGKTLKRRPSDDDENGEHKE
jgi:hypothetical protein